MLSAGPTPSIPASSATRPVANPSIPRTNKATSRLPGGDDATRQPTGAAKTMAAIAKPHSAWGLSRPRTQRRQEPQGPKETTRSERHKRCCKRHRRGRPMKTTKTSAHDDTPNLGVHVHAPAIFLKAALTQAQRTPRWLAWN